MNLKELSEKLGLSQTTVSRALNGYPEVSETTRKRVVAAARAANYSPSTRARSLATGRAMSIGHVIPVATRHEMVNPVFGDFIAGASEVYAVAGYEMLLSLVPDGEEEDVYRALKAKAAVDGIVVHAPRMADPRIALLDELALPFVVHGRASEIDTPYSWVDVPNRGVFREATDHLTSQGHTRIALINGQETMDFAFRRRLGFEDALADANLSVDARWMHAQDMTEAYGYEATCAMLAMSPAPTAFLVASLITALGVQRAVIDAGFRLGKDVSVLTFDDDLSYLRNGTGENAIFTAVRSSVRDAGRTAANMLLERIENPNVAHKTHMMDTQFVVGGSTGPAPD
ncbi:MAG: substrate-binding domain-containing protein [Marinovum sp.]|nr:substrate-binding domain-containing protein [Marinovum sp.]